MKGWLRSYRPFTLSKSIFLTVVYLLSKVNDQLLFECLCCSFSSTFLTPNRLISSISHVHSLRLIGLRISRLGGLRSHQPHTLRLQDIWTSSVANTGASQCLPAPGVRVVGHPCRIERSDAEKVPSLHHRPYLSAGHKIGRCLQL